MKEINSGTQMAKIRDYEKGFYATHLINIGAKLGIFETLNEVKDGMTVPALASKLGLHEPFLRIWCQTAYHFEILDCDNHDRFRLQLFLDEILGDKSHFRDYSKIVALTVDLIGKWFEGYPEYFRAGKTGENLYTPERSKAYYESSKNIHLVFLSMIIPQNDHLKQMLEQGIRFLDIGCGRGYFIVQLARTFEKSIFVGVDHNTYGIGEAENTISQLGLEKQVYVENIGGEELPYNDEFDLASMVISFHEISPDVRLKVVEKAYRALKSNGQLLILDFPYPGELEDFRNPMYDYGILEQFFESCFGVVLLNMGEKKELLTKAGFNNIQRTDVVKGMLELVTATK